MLHLVEPLGFSIDDRQLRRAGLDYWQHVDVHLWKNLDALLAAHPADRRRFFLTTKARRPYYEERFRAGDLLIFGRETRGLPEPLLAANRERLLTIPMRPETRSLNLATAVAAVLFEGMRQLSTAG